MSSCVSIAPKFDLIRHSVWFSAVLIALLFMAIAMPARAQSLSISANDLTFWLDRDPTPSQTLTITTTWQQASSDQLNVCLYMTTPLVGTGTNTATIAASSVQVNGTALGVGNGKPQCGVHGAQLISVTTVNNSGSRTDMPSVRIANYSTTLPVDTYTGQVSLVAITY